MIKTFFKRKNNAALWSKSEKHDKTWMLKTIYNYTIHIYSCQCQSIYNSIHIYNNYIVSIYGSLYHVYIITMSTAISDQLFFGAGDLLNLLPRRRGGCHSTPCGDGLGGWKSDPHGSTIPEFTWYMLV
jgi:hypothetical protein